ncbi:MAG: malto-oligosyltrehalose synthase [Steroidobacteraceae bacterium]
MNTSTLKPRTLRATYRVQLSHRFTFADAERIVPYLAQLGISHLYASPILKARPGSDHGYDVVDHNALNPELGTRAEFESLVAALHQHDMGLIVDIVPNHLGVMGHDNVWWLDVLENGPAAQYAGHFDIDWRPARHAMRDRLLVPVLGASYGTVLERGELKLQFDASSGSFAVCYYEHLFPVDPRTYAEIFRAQQLQHTLDADDPNCADFESLLDAFARLPSRSDTSPEARAERYRDKEVHKRRLVRLCERSPEIVGYIHAAVAQMNGRPDEPHSFDALHALLEAQTYRLSFWRVATDEINFRRFFDINDLAALRMDDPAVFEATHAFIYSLIDAGMVDGLRVDHVDGLYDPEGYLQQVQARSHRPATDGKPLYVVVEKILASHERLPLQWAVHGTTGYDFATVVNSWLVDTAAEETLTRIHHDFVGRTLEFDDLAYQSKKLIMRISLAAEIGVLATQLDRIAQLDRHTADFTRNALREVIIETIACFPVYRTYISPRGISDEDRRNIHWAISVARRRSLAADLSAFDFLQAVLLGEAASAEETAATAMLEFAMKFQQVSSPVMAKGVEDTASYRYNRLVSLNEVGGDPKRFGVSTNALHLANQERCQQWPMAMLATSTHDTKRSEDVRARIAVISEMPDRWRRHLARWNRLNRSKRVQMTEGPAPSRSDEYLLYQTLIGIWPVQDEAGSTTEFIERVQAYVVKAAREAKSVTSWLNPHAEYEQALTEFVNKLLERPAHNAFLRDFSRLAAVTSYFGHLNSLSQTLLKLTSPGIADIYQGTAIISLSLVDPDNRRAVEFSPRSEQLEALNSRCINGVVPPDLLNELLHDWQSGMAKLYLTWATLNFRKLHAELFVQGSYEPMRVTGGRAEHVCAYARRLNGSVVMVIVPRWLVRLTDEQLIPPLGNHIWTDTRVEWPTNLTVSSFVNIYTGKTMLAEHMSDTASFLIGDVLDQFPVALLTGREDQKE